ncbi:GspE/PulE family protein [Limnohabitans sp. Rim28]|uniref:GspE/PulE family protein n=1 Tax=Limnohabitans sp. Rim28 TaxID=1100720 RepID=UPI0002E5AA7D|nr:ATPase, T2SS/T4P/T4SS family [Limnohabitans sp. Rim28]PVE08741.1 hypothetical protein B472_03105 [Limnohabitans sp. Rim28]
MNDLDKLSNSDQVRHLWRLSDVPEHSEVLTSLETEYPGGAPTSTAPETVCIANAAKEVFLISTPAALHGPLWFHKFALIQKAGFTYADCLTAEPDVLEMLALGIHAQGQQAKKDQAEDARVKSSLVNESGPLSWFKKMIATCHEMGASDIHFEVRDSSTRIRVRHDGVMRHVMSIPSNVVLDGLSASFTVLAEERSRSEVAFNAQAAQACMIPLTFDAENINLRYQSHPVVSGVDVTLRILKTSVSTKSELMTLDKLGYTPQQVELLELASGSANGGVFVSGVTGSGKTTTLNAMLRAIATEGIRKVISIEDPVEYVVPGVSHFSIQRQSNSDTGKNPFLGAMLAFLRMDPDVGMVGEVRDNVSAQIVQAAIQTGHKIFSTVHATSALGIVSRLNSQAIALPRDTLCGPEFISALVYQVLVPKNCPACSRPATQVMKPAELAPYAEFFDLNMDALMCASDGGCPLCRVKGLDYNGSLRAGVKGVKVGAEVIVPDEPLLQLLSAGKDIEARNHWRSQRTARFDDADTLGKEAWGHVLYDMSRGLIDPFYFEKIFGRPSLFRQAARIRA